MAWADPDIELLLARWVLDDLLPDEVSLLATNALSRGCEATSVAVLAGLKNPSRADILDELPALLRELALTMPSQRKAVRVAVNGLAREIVAGDVSPSEGAHRLWSSYANDAQLRGDDEVWAQLVGFVGLAVELDEGYRPSSVIDPEIVESAKALLAAGGPRITDAHDEPEIP